MTESEGGGQKNVTKRDYGGWGSRRKTTSYFYERERAKVFENKGQKHDVVRGVQNQIFNTTLFTDSSQLSLVVEYD